MYKHRRKRYRTIRHIGLLRDYAAEWADRLRDPDYPFQLPPMSAPHPFIVEGNRNERMPSTPDNRWGMIRQRWLNTPHKNRRLRLRRLRQRCRAAERYGWYVPKRLRWKSGND